MKKNIFLSVIIIFAVIFYFGITTANSWSFQSRSSTGNIITHSASSQALCLSTQNYFSGLGEEIITPCSNNSASNSSSKNNQSTYFAGKITRLKSFDVENYESVGYKCVVPGRTIEIRPIKGQTSYFIPEGTYSKTRHELNPGQSIMGKEQSTQNINCKRCETVDEGLLDKSDQQCTEVNFNIPIITLFGTSRI